MSYLGIDVGTTGVKSAIVADDGKILAISYLEYDFESPNPGWAQLNASKVFEKTKKTIILVLAKYPGEKIDGISVTSLGEAVVPVTKDGRILGPSILNFDRRGEEFLGGLAEAFTEEDYYHQTGNTLRNHFTLTKLLWIKANQPDVYKEADYFLPWTSFISFMLGADPVVDYSLANRTLLFDINLSNWSEEILDRAGLAREKLPEAKIAGSIIGEVSSQMSKEFNLNPGIPIVIGAHDQPTNAVGCGVVEDGMAMLGMGTFTCATPVFTEKVDPKLLIPLGVNTEHHAIPGHYVSFIYNHGGSVVKWFRDTFAAYEQRMCQDNGEDVYNLLFSEVPESPVNQVYLPYLSTTGLPDFDPNVSGLFSGLRLDTSRGEILKGIIQGIIFDLKMTIDRLNQIRKPIKGFHAVGGGSRSSQWLQVCADIFNCPITTQVNPDTGVMGCAIITGMGLGKFDSYLDAVGQMVHASDVILPREKNQALYKQLFDKFLNMRMNSLDYLSGLSEVK